MAATSNLEMRHETTNLGSISQQRQRPVSRNRLCVNFLEIVTSNTTDISRTVLTGAPAVPNVLPDRTAAKDPGMLFSPLKAIPTICLLVAAVVPAAAEDGVSADRIMFGQAAALGGPAA